MATLGQRLKKLILEKGITQRKLAQFLDYDDTSISMYCHDYREPDIETLKKMAGFFDCTIDYLTGYSNISQIPDDRNIRALLEYTPPLNSFIFDPKNVEYLKLAYRIKHIELELELEAIEELLFDVPFDRLLQELSLLKRLRKKNIAIKEIEGFTLKTKA